MAHVLAVATSRWPSPSSPAHPFQDLPTTLHRVIASYLHASEALKVGVTEHGMQGIYTGSINHATIRLRLLSNYAQRRSLSASEWEAYLVRHGASLARLLIRLPSLTTLTTYWKQHGVVAHAIFLQPCKQLVSIDSKFSRSSGDDAIPGRAFVYGRPNMLHSAIIKSHLPFFDELEIRWSHELATITDAVRAGHLAHIKRLKIYGCEDEPLLLQSLLEVFTEREEKLEALYLHINTSSTEIAMHNLLCSPVCSDLRKLHVKSNRDEDEDENEELSALAGIVYERRHSTAFSFLSKYLKGAGMGGRASLRELIFSSDVTEDVSCLADALLFGGEGGLAPNLETITFKSMKYSTVQQLGTHLFARGALTTILTLEFSYVHFGEHGMTDLMDGFRLSGRAGCTIKKLKLNCCNNYWHINSIMRDRSAKEASLALIKGHRNGVFPNLEELLTPGGALLVGEVAELVEMLKGGAPCARTLKKVVMSKDFLQSADVEPLQAILPQAIVTCEFGSFD